MEIKSQICTSVEQSKRLLTLGLNPETADMSYYSLNGEIVLTVGIANVRQEILKGGKVVDVTHAEVIPAWSLHRLIEIAEVSVEISGLWVKISGAYRYEERDNVFDNIIDAIAELINNDVFNKEHLNI